MTGQPLRLVMTLTTLMILGSAAYADPVTLTPGSSVTLNFTAPDHQGAASATFTLSSSGAQLTINFQNLTASRLSVIAFNTTPDIPPSGIASFAFSGLPAGSNPAFGRNLSVGDDFGGGGTFEFGIIPSFQNNPVGLLPGQGGTLVLTFSSPHPSLTLETVIAHLVLADGRSRNVQGIPALTPPPPPIPEPATLLLVGTGLAVAAAGLRKWKTGSPDR